MMVFECVGPRPGKMHLVTLVLFLLEIRPLVDSTKTYGVIGQ
jgi:hypothetical protein